MKLLNHLQAIMITPVYPVLLQFPLSCQFTEPELFMQMATEAFCQ